MPTRLPFEDFYEAQYRAMVRVAIVLVDTRERAEEVVQDRRMLRRGRPAPPADHGELGFNHVLDAIQRLPHRQRSMIVLRYELQLTDREIADALDVRWAVT